MKKLFVIILICVAAIGLVYGVLAGVGVVPIPEFVRNLFGDKGFITSIERIELLISDTYPTDIIVLGDDIGFEGEVSYRLIETANEESLNAKPNCSYSFLVINDLSGNVHLSEDEILLIDSMIQKEKFCLLYLGEKYATLWDEPEEYIANVEGNLSYRYFVVNNVPRRFIGAWGAQEEELKVIYPYLLGDVVLYEIEAFLLDIN